ncbi:MAG TPA: hypothetical protein VGT05_01350 [Patescibacteria group bacterium]|nr:hypothetical protein [Patescibacteria group bacterium]
MPDQSPHQASYRKIRLVPDASHQPVSIYRANTIIHDVPNSTQRTTDGLRPTESSTVPDSDMHHIETLTQQEAITGNSVDEGQTIRASWHEFYETLRNPVNASVEASAHQDGSSALYDNASGSPVSPNKTEYVPALSNTYPPAIGKLSWQEMQKQRAAKAERVRAVEQKRFKEMQAIQDPDLIRLPDGRIVHKTEQSPKVQMFRQKIAKETIQNMKKGRNLDTYSQSQIVSETPSELLLIPTKLVKRLHIFRNKTDKFQTKLATSVRYGI